jgi:hypothetical protein
LLAVRACATSSSTKVVFLTFCRAHFRSNVNLSDQKIVYRRYASLYFIAGIDSTDNELITLEIVHRFVEQMDKYYGNVCELDIIFNFQKAYFILDELLLAGEMQESSKKNVLRCIGQQDSLEDMEVSCINLSHASPLHHDTLRQHFLLCHSPSILVLILFASLPGRRRWRHEDRLDEVLQTSIYSSSSRVNCTPASTG